MGIWAAPGADIGLRDRVAGQLAILAREETHRASVRRCHKAAYRELVRAWLLLASGQRGMTDFVRCCGYIATPQVLLGRFELLADQDERTLQSWHPPVLEFYEKTARSGHHCDDRPRPRGSRPAKNGPVSDGTALAIQSFGGEMCLPALSNGYRSDTCPLPRARPSLRAPA